MRTLSKLLMSLFSLLFLIFMISCSKEKPVEPNIPEDPVVTPGPLTESHTLIVFMQGDNGLEEFMDVNLQRIVTAYYDVPQDLGKVVVFYDRGNYTRLTELYLSDGMTKQRVIKEYSNTVSTVDPDFVKGVFDLIRQEVPSESYGLILSSHGGGWVPADIFDLYLYLDTANEQPLAERSFYGQDGYDCMELPQLAQALEGWDFRYVIFDACYMASVEGLYDVRGLSDYIIASSAEIMGTGFPYEDIIPILFSREDHSLVEACEAYMDMYRESSGTISLIDCTKLENLAQVMLQINQAEGEKLVDVSNIQPYEAFSTHLYFDFEQYVEALTSNEELLSMFDEVLSDVVLFTDHTSQFFSAVGDEAYIDLPCSCGLTCYVYQPGCENTHAAYLQTSWAKAVGAY